MKKIILLCLLVVEMFLIGNVYSENITNEISTKLLRMHILANSNDEFDQSIKIKVRDFLLNEIKENDFKSKEEVVKKSPEIEDKINDFLTKNGVEYIAKAEIADTTFQTKNYSDLSIPAGNYQALKIILGDGEGENWWCVAYPPLCFTESVTGKISEEGNVKLNNMLNQETYNIIKNDKIEFKIKFKTIELINSFITLN